MYTPCAATGTLKVESLYSALDVYDTKFAADIRFPEGRRMAALVSKPSSIAMAAKWKAISH